MRTESNQEILRIKLDETGSCQLQTEGHLCSLQQKHGHSLLPIVCQTYPRVAVSIGGFEFSSLFLSYPEVAKAVLFHETGPVFRKSAPKQINFLTSDDQVRHTLTELVDRVMAGPKYTLATRAFYLADVIVKLARLSVQKKLNATSFNQIIANSKNDVYQIGVGLKTGRLRPQPIISGAFWHLIARIGRGINLLTELDALSPLLIHLSEDPAIQAEQYNATHTEIQRLRKASHHVWRTYDAHFTRYLHASLMCNGFPWNPESNNYIATLMRAMVPFALARLRLWLLADKQGTLQNQDVIDITYRVERAISHNHLVFKILDQNPELLELDQYHMAFLLL